MKILGLEPELQLSLQNSTSALKMSKLIVVSLQRFVLDKSDPTNTLDLQHHLRPLFMEWHPDVRMQMPIEAFLFDNQH